MIQQQRSINSTSLLREASSCVLVLDSEENIDYFQNAIDKVVENRKDPDIRYTGAKDTRRELLSLLNQYGEVKTANVWCRGIIVDLAHINQLRRAIAEELAQKNIYGVVEVHLQDREINSPHIQFVGIRAQEAENIIANIVVNLKYELSTETAKGGEFTPYFEENPKAHTSDLSYYLDKEQKRRLLIEKESENINEFVSYMQAKRDEFRKILNEGFDEVKETIKKPIEIKNAKKIYEMPTSEAINDINERVRQFRRQR